jgi:glycosyltransferase involved in cell wall biosynthesis
MTGRLCLEHVPRHHIGYGRAGMELYAACERAGLAMSSSAAVGDAETVVSMMNPPMVKGWLSGQRRVIFTMYETTDCPAQYRVLTDFDMVIVPCDANVEAFSKWHPNVAKVPLGANPDHWRFQPRPASGPFTFLTRGAEPRKGVDATCAAFQQAFPNNRDVRLVVHFAWPSHVVVPSDPRITVITDRLSLETEIALHADAHCYVGLSRGEGWGMMPLQAIMQGCPTILTDAHGHAEFAHLAVGVATSLTPAADYMRFGEAGDWWEPDVEDAAVKMRDVYDRYDSYLETATVCSRVARDELNWDRAAQQLIDALGGIDSLGPYTGSGEFVRRCEPLVPIVVNRNIECEIADVAYRFECGVEQWGPADVRRVLRDAGYIDDDCWNDPRSRLPEVVPL